MSADGNIEVSVQAEGVDDAAEELADRDGGGGDGEGGGGGFGTAITGGIVGGLISQLLGPLLDVLDPILQILNAFLAPLAVLALRLLQPVLRQLIRLLPAWFDFVNELIPVAERIGQDIAEWLSQITPEDIARAINNLDVLIQDITGEVLDALAAAIVEALTPEPTVPEENRELSPDLETGFFDPRTIPLLREAFFAGRGVREDIQDNNNQAGNVIIRGGLTPFISGIERSADIDGLFG